jgi:hypothetical protein
MGTEETKDSLRNAIGQFSHPFTTTHEVKLVPMKLDAIVAILLGSPYVQSKLGPGRASEFAKASPELPELLRALGDEAAFFRAAALASDLLEISRPSVDDFDDTEGALMMANTTREKFYEACNGILTTAGL